MARNPKCEIMEKNPPWRDWLFSTNFRCCSLTFKRFSGLPSDLSSASNLVGGKVSSISGYGVLKYLWFFLCEANAKNSPCQLQWGGWESENQWGSNHPAISVLLVHFWELKTVSLKEKFKLYRPNCGRHFHPLFGSGKIEKSQAKAARNPGEFSVALWGYADAKKCLLLKIAPFSSSRTLPTSTLSPKILL